MFYFFSIYPQSSTQFYPFDLPCISACETTQRQYWHLQRLHVERLLAAYTTSTDTKSKAMSTSASLQPQLLHDNETLNTLTLKWPITTATTSILPALYLASRPFNIQYQYVLRAAPSASPSSAALTVNDTPDINSSGGQQQQQSKQHERLENQPSSLPQQDEGDKYDNMGDDDNESENGEQEVELAEQQQQWWNLADYNCNENFECDIMDGLMPYTSYKVRGFLTQ